MKYYCLGIKGTGMSTLAQILFDLGESVVGYDDARGHKFTQEGLEKREIPIYYDDSYPLDEGVIVTYSVACGEDHKELERARKSGAIIKKYNELVGDVISMFTTIGVSGTHGKTTTSSLIRHFLEETVGCNYFIGAGDGMVTKENKYFVVECDEFNRHFTVYHPKYAIITNIEKEHMECYKDLDDIRGAFNIFARNTEKLVVANGDNEDVRKIDYSSRVLFYGFNEENDVVIKNMKLEKDGSSFDLYIEKELFGSFKVPLYGRHMVMNTAAAITVVKELGLKADTIQKLLSTFHNATRRFAESFVKDTVIIDDYAHHPTEIKVTLEAVKQKYPDRTLAVVFKPNTYSRTRDFLDDFVNSLKIADHVYLTEIDCNREKQEDYPGVCSKAITDKIDGAMVIHEDTIQELKKEKGNVVCFMSCAYIDKLIEEFKKLIQEED